MAMMRENVFAIAADAQSGRYGKNERPENLLSAMWCSLLAMDQKLAKLTFELLAGEPSIGSVETIAQPAPVQVPGTQRTRPSPDMIISDDKISIIIEVKVSSKLEKQQLEDYLKVAEHLSKTTSKEHIVVYVDERMDLRRSANAQGHACYRKPEGKAHFEWQDIYDLYRSNAKGTSVGSQFRAQFADYMRDRIGVASDMRDAYVELYSKDINIREDCRNAFYQRYSLVRRAFEDHLNGWVFKQGSKGIDQYCEALIPGTEANNKLGRTNVVFRWVEDPGNQPSNWPTKFLQVSIRREAGNAVGPKGQATALDPIKLKGKSFNVGTRESADRKDFLFDIAPWVEKANEGPGLTEVLGACAKRVLAYLDPET